jgi:hypothetical protein
MLVWLWPNLELHPSRTEVVFDQKKIFQGVSYNVFDQTEVYPVMYNIKCIFIFDGGDLQIIDFVAI